MTTTQDIDALDMALARLEQQLELPYVPGELNSWTSGVHQQCQVLLPTLRQEIEGEHPKLFQQILKNDLELAKRVEQLKQGDCDLCSAAEAVLREAETLDRTVDEKGIAETVFEPKRSRLVEMGLQFVLQVRKQRAAANTWFKESLQRDTGQVD